jgi:hypothetical protein
MHIAELREYQQRLALARNLRLLDIRHSRGKKMPQSTHNRSAELHNLAEHDHDAAARDKSDHLSPHELTKQAEEHSEKTRKRDEGLAAKAAKRNKA